MLIAYLRVSTRDQRFDLQLDALKAAGVEERYCYYDIASGAKQDRPNLAACLKALHPGDTLVVWKLDRIARSLLHLLEILRDLQARDIGLRILEGVGAQMNPTTHEGKLFLQMLGAFAEFERNLIRERVVAGLAAAKLRGRHGGRKPKLSPMQRRQARDLVRQGWRITEIAREWKVSRHTVYAALREEQPQEAAQAADGGGGYGDPRPATRPAQHRDAAL